MEPQTSFIPKKPLSKDAAPREEPTGLFTIIATIAFFASLLAAGGVFGYKAILERNIASAAASLDRAQKAFEPQTIVELERLDGRITSSRRIVEGHSVITPLFRLLEASTIPEVRFSKFHFSFLNSDKIELGMSGEAKSYSFVALQSDEFGKSKYFKNVIFSNLNLDQSGNVTFDLSAVIDPELVSYKTGIDRGDIIPTP